jgi:hypothetical protein
MSKVHQLLEAIKQVRDEEQKGTYEVTLEFSADLSREAEHHEYSDSDVEGDPDQMFDDIAGDYRNSYMRKQLEKQIWDQIRHHRGVSGMEFEFEILNKKHYGFESAQEVKEVLKNLQYRLTVKISTQLDSEMKTDVDNALAKAIEGAIK